MTRMLCFAAACGLLAGCATTPTTAFDCTAISADDAAAKLEELPAKRLGRLSAVADHYQELAQCVENLPIEGGGRVSIDDYWDYGMIMKSEAASRGSEPFDQALTAYYRAHSRYVLDTALSRVESSDGSDLTRSELDDLRRQSSRALMSAGFVGAAFDEQHFRIERTFRAAEQRIRDRFLNTTCRRRAQDAGLPLDLLDALIMAFYESNPIATDFTRLVCGMTELGDVRYRGERAPEMHGLQSYTGGVVWFQKGNYGPLDIDAWEPVGTAKNGMEYPLTPKEAMALLLTFSGD